MYNWYKSSIMRKEDILDSGEPFFRFNPVEELLSHLDERANDKHAHLYGRGAP